MQFFTGSTATLDRMTDPDLIVKVAPQMAERFDAIKDIRDADPDGSLYRGSEFRHVASLVSVPLTTVAKLVEPEFLTSKKKFYEWLTRHPEYCTYDRRKAKKRSDLVTFIDGKEV